MEGYKKYENLPMENCYMQKDFCEKIALQKISDNHWSKVTAEQLTKEIFGHAFVFYKFRFLKKIPFLNKMIYSHVENGIDIADHVDTFQPVWNILWEL